MNHSQHIFKQMIHFLLSQYTKAFCQSGYDVLTPNYTKYPTYCIPGDAKAQSLSRLAPYHYQL